MLPLKIKKLIPDIKTPSFAHPYDAAMDLYAREHVELRPGKWTTIPTGIAVEIPQGYALLIWDKSSLSMKFGLRTLGGVVDAGYRGEIMVGMVNLSSETYVFERNQKVAQMILQKVEHPDILVVDELSDSTRGERGFGSTGK